MHCNERWETIAAGQHADAKSAEGSAAAAYSGVAVPWVKFRELSAEEVREVATTSSFLRELASSENPKE